MSSDSTVPISESAKGVGGLSPVHLDPGSPIPLHRQIYEALRRDILGGSLPSGQRLLATRAMATELGVSRNTVLEAVEQLIAEGYLTARRGSGTFVASDLPEELLRVAAPSRPTGTGALPPLSTRGRALGRLLPAAEDRSRPFQLGRPALDRFPWRTWSRLLARRSREVPREWLDYGDPAGYPPLRRVLAHYLRASRGLRCVPEQIVIVRGSQQGIDLAARVLLDEGDPVWMEDPGYPAARLALSAAGAREVSVPVDAEGLDLEEGQVREPGARLVYVTPSHQYPLGVTLSLPRRLELLRWARQNGAWILEDDYDSEYRYAGRPLASLAGLDGGPEGSRHVIYLGTLSKVLFPALRLGYLVVPIEYVDAFVGARFANDRHTGLLEQAVVADFFAHGHFERHVRRMRQLYAERQRVLGQAMAEHLADEIELRPSDTGLHTLGTLRRGRDAEELSARAAEAGITVRALSAYCRRARLPPGLLFGYAGHPTAELRAAVERLARVMGSR